MAITVNPWARDDDYGYQVGGYVPPASGRNARNTTVRPGEEPLYDANYNPWGDTTEGYALKQEFEDRFAQNLDPALSEYDRLKKQAYGYSYTQVGGNIVAGPGSEGGNKFSPFGSNTRNSVTQASGMSKRTLFEMGYQEGDIISQTGGREGTSTSIVKPGGIARGENAWSESVARGDQEIKVAGDYDALSEQEKYMLYRYERRNVALPDTGVGTGAIDYDAGLDLAGAGSQIDKGQTGQFTQQGGPKLADKIGRSERAAGAKRFKRGTGVQL